MKYVQKLHWERESEGREPHIKEHWLCTREPGYTQKWPWGE